MKFVIGSDHAGRTVKEEVKKILLNMNFIVEDVSPKNTEYDDYPDYAKKVAKEVQKGGIGFLSCGTGIGVSIVANKHKGVRAALIHSKEEAELARKHNDANVLVLSGSKKYKDLESIVKTFLTTKFEGGRHNRRVEKIE